MAEQTVMDVVNAALAGEVPDEPLEDTGVASDNSDDGAGDVEAGDDQDASGDSDEDGEGGEPGGDAPDGDKPAGEESEADLAAEADKLGVSVRNANGQFKSKEQLATDVEAARKAAADKGGVSKDGKDEKGKPKKEPDPVNDPIPQGLKKETETRIRTLIDRTKQSEERATVAEGNFNTIVQGLQATGTTPEQYSEVLSFMQLFNSGDAAQQGKALELLEDMADRLATMLGRERTVSDPLKAHPDLQAAIQQGKTTREYALEVARVRNQRGFQTQLQTTATQQAETARAAAQEKEQARVDLNNLEAGLSKDPLYQAKYALVLPQFKEVIKHIPPREWAGAFQRIYAATVVQRPAARTTTRLPTNQPLRQGRNPSGAGSGGGGDMKTQPKSALDAVNAALAGMK